MSNNSVSIHRVLKANPQKVYKAFTQELAIASWLPPYGFLCSVQQMEAKVGGSFKMTFHNFSTDHSHSFGGTYIALEPGVLVKYVESFDDPNFPGDMTTTVQLKEVSCGTEIKIVQEGIPAVIPTEMCYLGWQESLEKLTKLVEPVISDGI